MGYGVLHAPRSRSSSTSGRADGPPPPERKMEVVDSLVPLARFTNAYEVPDRTHLIPSWGQGQEDKWDWSGCWDDLLAHDALLAERRRNLLAQSMEPETTTDQSQEAAQPAASDVKLDPKQQAERLLHQQAKNLILTLYAQSQYNKARSRLQRGRGTAMDLAEAPQDMSAIERSLAAVRQLGLDPIQVLRTGGFNTKQIQLVLDASKQLAAQDGGAGASGGGDDGGGGGLSDSGSALREQEEQQLCTPRSSPRSQSERSGSQDPTPDDLLADVRQVRTYLPSIQPAGSAAAKGSPAHLLHSISLSKSSPSIPCKPSPPLLPLPGPNSPLGLGRSLVGRTSCEGSVRLNRGGLLGSSLSSSPLKSRWTSESGAAAPGPRPDAAAATAALGRADIALPPVALLSQGSMRHQQFSPAKLLARGASKDRFASLVPRQPGSDITLSIGLQ